MSPEILRLSVGPLTLTARAWGSPDAPLVLALHGWMDNAASFDPLAELLSDRLRVVALDLPGHGHSDHRPAGVSYPFSDWIGFVDGALDALGWERPALMGHSLGASIAIFSAGTFPERVRKLVIIEGIGPLTTTAEDSPERLAKSVKAFAQAPRPARVYESLDAVCDRICAGNGALSRRAAMILARWGTEELVGGVRFRHDRRLKYPSPHRFTEAHVQAFIKRITAPTLGFVADSSLAPDDPWLRQRLAHFADIELVQVPGHHHVHLDAPNLLASKIGSFLI